MTDTKADGRAEGWDDRLRRTLGRYGEPLLRAVADRLLRLRTRPPAEELIERMAGAMANAAVLDRRLKALPAPARGLLALIGLSRQPAWRLGGVLELASCLDVADGMGLVFQLFESGLLFPEVPSTGPALKSFEEWLGRASPSGYVVFVPPEVTARAVTHGLELPRPPAVVKSAAVVCEADGLEPFLRLGVLWQQVRTAPLRLTQQGTFFKKDQERLAGDPLLTGPAADEVVPMPHQESWLVALGLGSGALEAEDAQLVAADFPAWRDEGLTAALVRLWAALPALDSWHPAQGWRGLSASPSPFGSAGVAALALLAGLGEDDFLRPADVCRWLAARHCFWHSPPAGEADPAAEAEVDGDERGGTPPDEETTPTLLTEWGEAFLLGIAYQLRLVQAGRTADGEWAVRLSPTGRAVLGLGPPPALPGFPQTLLVQPNLEIVAYRQGLTPGLLGKLTRFAAWRSLGAACTLQLQPETVYRGLESGLTLEQVLQTLQQHGVREMPAAVVQALRTWADKRERLAVYAAAALLEFTNAADLQAALGRGVPGIPLSDRLLLVPNEADIDFRHLRLAGTRDYALPPGQCVEVGADGVTLTVDPGRADLLLDTELQRFAEPAAAGSTTRPVYRLTPASLGRARDAGLGFRMLEDWFLQRAGQAVPPAVRLLFAGGEGGPASARRLLVVEVPTALTADGLMQWPETQALIQGRLGPTALAVAEANLEPLARLLAGLGLELVREPPPAGNARPPGGT
jgi:hypothetical protein